MKVLSSILPSEEIQTQIQCKFPSVEFSFYKGIRAAQHEWTEAEIFITYGEDLNKEYIDKANNLKWIMVMSAGMEKMPFQACKEKGIIITNAKGIHKVPMAEFTIGAMLQHSKQMKALW
jgi:phosphoglycerate dehydrogenase-like enzyme